MTFRSTLLAGFALAALVGAAAPAQASANLLVNGGFEGPDLSEGQYTYPFGTTGSWYYWGSALVNAEGGSAWWPNGQVLSGYEGTQFAALQSTSVLAQTFDFNGGGLALSWLDAGRPFSYGGCCNGDQTYKVALYNFGTGMTTDVGQYATVSGVGFNQKSANVSLAAGQYALVFQGLSGGRDETAFIDSVSAIGGGAVPEPATWALMIAGFGGAGAMLRRRRAAMATA